MGLGNFIKNIFKTRHHLHEKIPIKKSTVPFKLRHFTFDDKFVMSFDNALFFTGYFNDDTDKKGIGKILYIPLSEKHPPFTLKISGQSKSVKDIYSSIIKFNSEEERKVISDCDFSGDVFYIEN